MQAWNLVQSSKNYHHHYIFPRWISWGPAVGIIKMWDKKQVRVSKAREREKKRAFFSSILLLYKKRAGERAERERSHTYSLTRLCAFLRSYVLVRTYVRTYVHKNSQPDWLINVCFELAARHWSSSGSCCCCYGIGSPTVGLASMKKKS